MRMIVFFDLPTITAEDKRNYLKFRKMLMRNGFLMMQESVYCRLALNQSVVDSLSDTIRKNRPTKGIVQLLTVTEKQFSKMEYICGSVKNDVLNTDEKVVIL